MQLQSAAFPASALLPRQATRGMCGAVTKLQKGWTFVTRKSRGSLAQESPRARSQTTLTHPHGEFIVVSATGPQLL